MGLAALKANTAVGVIMLLNALVFTAQAAMGVVLLKKVHSNPLSGSSKALYMWFGGVSLKC